MNTIRRRWSAESTDRLLATDDILARGAEDEDEDEAEEDEKEEEEEEEGDEDESDGYSE